MYKGNMYDFCDKVNNYLRKSYSCRLFFSRTFFDGGKLSGSIVAFFAPGQKGALAYAVYDREDFEKQIYDFVNKKLEENNICIKVT